MNSRGLKLVLRSPFRDGTSTHVLAITFALPALFAIQSSAQSTYEPYTFTTLAGRADTYGSTEGMGTNARFNMTGEDGSGGGVAVDSAGDIYVADTGNNTIRRVTPEGVVTTLAGLAQLDTNGNPVFGSADGTRRAAQFNKPSALAVDSVGNVYVADTDNHTIRKVSPLGGVTTLAGLAGNFGSADGNGTDARFNYPRGIAVDSAGNVYVADTGNSTIRKVTPAGAVTTLAGLAGSFGSEDAAGNAARFGRRTTITIGMITPISLSFYQGPAALAVDSAGNVYVADTGNGTIRKVTPAGVVTTLAGQAGNFGSTDGTGSDARFGTGAIKVDNEWATYIAYHDPSALAVDGEGNLYEADSGNSTLRKVTPAGVVTTVAGFAGNPGALDGAGSSARFGSFRFGSFGFATLSVGPAGVAVDSAGNVYVADSGNNTIRKGYPALRILMSAPDFGSNGGHFGFNLTGSTGHSVIVEASADLVNWLPIWTNTFTGTLSFSDPQSGSFSRRFYRTRAQ